MDAGGIAKRGRTHRGSEGQQKRARRATLSALSSRSDHDVGQAWALGNLLHKHPILTGHPKSLWQNACQAMRMGPFNFLVGLACSLDSGGCEGRGVHKLNSPCAGDDLEFAIR